MATGRPKTAFVFAGGGSLGAIQVGALRELILAGERPDFVVGASVGALNACFFAARPDQAGVAALEAIWRDLKRDDVFPLGWRGVMRWFRGGDSLFEPLALRRLIERELPLAKLEDAAIPVHVVATNLSGAPVALTRGPAVEAVLASSAIPIAFPSVRIGMDHLMDGAIAGNTPILTAAELGAERIIVLQTGYACSMDGPPRGAVARGMHALTLLISNQMERDLKLLAGKVGVHVSPHLCPLDVSPFDFTQAAALIERAAANTRAWIDEGGLGRGASVEAFAHDHAGMMQAGPVADGFDLVSYFDAERAPRRGVSAFRASHGGRAFLFASAANRDLFLADPERFLPKYGGLCAFAMASGKRVASNPLNYRIVDGRLYFNLNTDVQMKWDRDRDAYIRRANAHWKEEVW